MADFVVAHGAWSGSWAWKRMQPLMAAAGHTLHVPALTGLGERHHASGPHVDLEMHITDVAAHIEMEDLGPFVLVGHSYGGMVATGIADRFRDRVTHLLYLDAFVPRDGESLLDLQPPDHRRRVEEAARHVGEGWLVPPQPLPPDTAPEDVAWIMPRRFGQPLATFLTPLRLTNGGYAGPRTYMYCTRCGPSDTFRPFAERARREPGWRYAELDASHSPHITNPVALMALLEAAAAP